MTQFEYLTVLVSLVLALGISEILLCWVRILQHRETVRFSWLHEFWSVFVIALMIQFWWGFWNYRVIERWAFLGLATIVTQTMLVVVAAALLTPGRQFDPDIDLEQLYFDNARPFFLIGAVMLVLLSAGDIIMLQSDPGNIENIIRYIGIAATCAMAFVTEKKIHYIAAFLFGSLLVTFQLNAVIL